MSLSVCGEAVLGREAIKFESESESERVRGKLSDRPCRCHPLGCALKRNDASAHVANLGGLEINLFFFFKTCQERKKAQDTTRVLQLAN